MVLIRGSGGVEKRSENTALPRLAQRTKTSENREIFKMKTSDNLLYSFSHTLVSSIAGVKHVPKQFYHHIIDFNWLEFYG